MTATRHFGPGKVGFLLCTSLLGVLVGCIHAQPPAPGVVYVAPPTVAVSVEIRTESDFYEPLTPYGEWVVVGAYGRCWRPGRVETNWRPYCNGHWQRTEAGWYWASEEPWGWATYHYGRWDWNPEFGWYWMPMTQWGPAWVSWHEGGGYVGWAPLQPSARVSARGSVEVVAVIQPRAFVFVESRHFLQPVRPSSVVVNNTTIINKTVNITNIKVVNKTVINEGPRTTIIEKASGQKVRPVAIQELRRKEEAPVVARQRAAPAISNRPVPAPVHSAIAPAGKNIQPEPERRTRETEQKIPARPPKNTKELEKKAPAELEPRTKPLETKSAEPQRPGPEKKATVKKGPKGAEEKTPGKRPEPKPLEKPAEPPPPKN